LYGAETWTIDSKLQKELDGYYTKMLPMALDVLWRQMIPNAVLYNDLLAALQKIRLRRMKPADHCVRHEMA